MQGAEAQRDGLEQIWPVQRHVEGTPDLRLLHVRIVAADMNVHEDVHEALAADDLVVLRIAFLAGDKGGNEGSDIGLTGLDHGEARLSVGTMRKVTSPTLGTWPQCFSFAVSLMYSLILRSTNLNGPVPIILRVASSLPSPSMYFLETM